MTNLAAPPIDPVLDLLLEREVDVSPELMWLAWTTPRHVMQWFAPAPWSTVQCDIDLRPGGMFRTVMRSPEGQDYPNVGCYLEIIPNQRLIWTVALAPGFRPAALSGGPPAFTAVISFAPSGAGTRYTALAMHRDEEGRQTHEAMGFHMGWGKATEQLTTLARTIAHA